MPRTPTFLEERTTFAGSRSSSAWRAWIQSKKLLMVLSHRVHEGYQGRGQLFTAPSLHCSGCNEPRNTKAPSGAALNLHKNTINPQKNQLLHLTSHPREMQGSFYNVHTCNPEALVISSVTGLHWFGFSSWLFSVYEIKYWHFLTKSKKTLWQLGSCSLRSLHGCHEDQCWLFLALVLCQHLDRQLARQLFCFGPLVCE